MKFKRVKDGVLAANQRHVMLSGVEGKTIVITSLDFYSVIKTNKPNKSEASRDNVALAVTKKANQNNVVLAIGVYCIGGAPTPFYLASDEELIISASGDQYNSSGKQLNYLIAYEEIENA